MNDKTKQDARIPAESIVAKEAVSPWPLIKMEDKEKITRSAKRPSKKKSNVNTANEYVEDYSGKVKIKPITAEKLKEITDQAHREGLKSGHDEGLARGLEEGRAQGLQQGKDKAYRETKKQRDGEVQRLISIIDRLMKPLKQQDRELENIIVDMAVQFARELVGAEINQQPEKFYSIIEQMIDALPVGEKNITIHLCDSDRKLIAPLTEDAQGWKIITDKAMSTGDCKVTTKESLIDFTIKDRIERYIEQVSDHSKDYTDAQIPVTSYRHQNEENTDQGASSESSTSQVMGGTEDQKASLQKNQENDLERNNDGIDQ